jgi:iron complex outermembrane recepter protein
MRKLLFQFLLGVLCIGANAQTHITGYISDTNHLPLAGACIFIPEANKGTISDKNGFYELKNIPHGKIRIQFSFLGYTSIVKTLNTTEKNVTLDITLEESVTEAEEIVVTGGTHSTQHENAVKIDVLKMIPSEIKSTPNFMETITKIPGVDMISKGSGVSKPVIRGLSMNDVLVLNNGVRFENYQYSDHHPLGIDEFGIEDVEVIKGPASLLYGSDAMGGVVNFIREKPAPQNSITGDYDIQLFSNSLGMTNNMGIKGAGKNFYAGIRAGQKTNADYLMGGGQFAPNTRFNEYSVKADAGYTGKKGMFNLFYDYNREKLGLAEEEAIEETRDRGRSCNIYYQQLNTHLLSSQNKLYLGNMKLDLNAAFQNTELIHYGEVNEYEIQMRLATLTYEARIYLPSDNKSEYILGFQGMNQDNSNLHNRETKLLPDASISNYSWFTLLQRTFLDKLKIQTGIRYDIRSLNTQSVGLEQDSATYRKAIDKHYGSFSGSLGGTYTVNDKLLVRINVATAYRTPNLAELTSKGQHETRFEIGDQSLSPEISLESDLSLHYHARNFTIDLAGFDNQIRDFIYITPTGDTTGTGVSIYRYRQNNSVLYGGETGLHIHPVHMEWLHLVTTYSMVIGKQRNGNYLPFIPAHKLNFEIKAESGKFAGIDNPYVTLNSTVAFDQNHAAPDETTTDGYTLVDAGMGGTIKLGSEHIEFNFGVNNLFDKKYIDHLSTLKEVHLFNPGRNVTLTVKVAFGGTLKKQPAQ